MVTNNISNTEHQFVLPYYARFSWNAREPRRKLEKLQLPVTHVRYTCTETEKCLNDGACLQAVEDLQKRDMKEGLADIRYNFLIGATGTVFEGRGWTLDADRPAKYGALRGKCLDIAYIGDYSVRHPPWEKTRAAFDLLRYGLKKKYIYPTYKIIPYRDVPLLNIPLQ